MKNNFFFLLSLSVAAAASAETVSSPSGDIVVDAEYLPADITPGDLLAVPATGAYCAPLSNNYNHVPRPPIVAVLDGRARVIVRGERLEDLLARDTGIDLGAQRDQHGNERSAGADRGEA